MPVEHVLAGPRRVDQLVHTDVVDTALTNQRLIVLLAALVTFVCIGGAAWLSFGDAARGAKLLAEAGLANFLPLAFIGAVGLVLLAVFRLQRSPVRSRP